MTIAFGPLGSFLRLTSVEGVPTMDYFYRRADGQESLCVAFWIRLLLGQLEFYSNLIVNEPVDFSRFTFHLRFCLTKGGPNTHAVVLTDDAEK